MSQQSENFWDTEQVAAAKTNLIVEDLTELYGLRQVKAKVQVKTPTGIEVLFGPLTLKGFILKSGKDRTEYSGGTYGDAAGVTGRARWIFFGDPSPQYITAWAIVVGGGTSKEYTVMSNDLQKNLVDFYIYNENHQLVNDIEILAFVIGNFGA